jgi:hypothetical protein
LTTTILHADKLTGAPESCQHGKCAVGGRGDFLNLNPNLNPRLKKKIRIKIMIKIKTTDWLNRLANFGASCFNPPR